MSTPYYWAPLEPAPALLKHIKGDWRKYIGCCRWVKTAEDLLSTAVMKFERSARYRHQVRRTLSRDSRRPPSAEETEAFEALHWVETVIVKKLRMIDAAITLQTAWRARRGRGQLVLLKALREIDLRLSRARYAKVVRATQVIQMAWSAYKCNKRLKGTKHCSCRSCFESRLVGRGWWGCE